MYEIHPNFHDQWVLYEMGDGSFDAVAWFHRWEDAEFARAAFENKRGQQSLSQSEADLHAHFANARNAG
jgi:hypothetical protein